MDFFQTIRERHSYRGPFLDRPLPRETLQKIVAAGLAAPSGKNAQTTRFVIVDDPEPVREIRALHATSRAMQTAAAYVVCLVDREPEAVYEGFSFQVEDMAAAVENMLLATAALGGASVWVDGWLRLEGRAEKIAGLLGVPEGKIPRVILPLGIPAEPAKGPAKLPFEKRACWNRYCL
jgi:nitroreductase